MIGVVHSSTSLVSSFPDAVLELLIGFASSWGEVSVETRDVVTVKQLVLLVLHSSHRTALMQFCSFPSRLLNRRMNLEDPWWLNRPLAS